MSYNQLDHSDLDAWTTPYGESMLATEEMFYPNRPRQRNPAAKRQPSLAALALMPKSRRIHQDTTKGLFSWPRECREALYLAVIHPYCGLPRTDNAHYNNEKEGCGYRFNHKKAMKLMVLCSRVWEEAIEIVHLAENVLCVAGKEGPVFRHPKDFGKPGFFHTTARSTMLDIPPISQKARSCVCVKWLSISDILII